MSSIEKIKALRERAATMSATEFVEAAFDDGNVFKFAAKELDGRAGAPPDRAAAERVVRAYEEGAAPEWMVAALLGRVGHEAGYPTVLAIARKGDNGYVEEALTRLAGPGTAEDMLALLRGGESPEARALAARVLGAIGARAAIAEVVAAWRAGRIGTKPARGALVGLAVDDATVEAWLRWGDAMEATLGCEVVFERLELRRNGGVKPSRALAPWVCTALDAAGVELLRYKREALRAWVEGG